MSRQPLLVSNRLFLRHVNTLEVVLQTHSTCLISKLYQFVHFLSFFAVICIECICKTKKKTTTTILFKWVMNKLSAQISSSIAVICPPESFILSSDPCLFWTVNKGKAGAVNLTWFEIYSSQMQKLQMRLSEPASARFLRSASFKNGTEIHDRK